MRSVFTADPRPLFRSELLTVRDGGPPERCASRHQVAFAHPAATRPRLRLDDGPPHDPTRVLFVPAGELPAPRRALLLGTPAWTVLGVARDAVPLVPDAAETTVPPRALLRFHTLRAAVRRADLRTRAAERVVEEEALALLALVLPPSCTTRAGARRRRAIVEGARTILAREPGRAHPLADVARALEISPSHLAHVFRAEVGMPLHRWLLHLRLAVALERLAGGDAHLSALALDLGFATHSHFSAAFRRWCGVTPAAARTMLASGRQAAEVAPRRAAS